MATVNPKGQIVNRTGLSDVFGVSLPTVDAWVRGNCPYVKRGHKRGDEWQFNTADVSKWLTEKRVAEATGAETKDENEIKLRKARAEMGVSELKLAKEMALVAPLDQVERSMAKVFAEVRANMRNIPGRVVSQLIGETDERRFKKVLQGEIDMALAALAAMDLTATDDDDDGEDAEETPE